MDKIHFLKTEKLAGTFISFIILIGVSFYSLVVFWPLPKLEKPVRVKIVKGETVSMIASQLEDKKVIEMTQPFILATQMMGYDKSIKTGMKDIYEAKTYFGLINKLVHGTPVYHKITIREGFNLDELAKILEDNLGVSTEIFLKICQNNTKIEELNLEVNSLEGFLYPETYYLEYEEDPETIVYKMTEQFVKNFDSSMIKRTEQMGLTIPEVVTLASIIQGEAIYDSERVIISAVFHNRLSRRMKLEADPTIQYIVDGPPRRLLYKDLKIDSPFNTYLYHGLPPGPINSPDKESLLAALYPAEVDYLYFVANGNGYHTFSKTNAEHLKAKKEFQKVRRMRQQKKETNG
tara:strand:- start:5624 stop:6667 length:1044 start_codon:yes stop_codon:yes gene_type:complete